MSALEFHIILDENGFQGMAADWNRLATATDNRSVFLRHEWFDAAWRWLDGSAELFIVCARRGDETVGICPLVRRTEKRSGLSLQVLAFLTVPDTQEVTLLADPENVRAIADGLFEYLASAAPSWDIADLDKLATGAPGFGVLTSAAVSAGFAISVGEAALSMGIGLADGWEAYYARRSRRLKKGNNHAANRIKRDDRTVDIRCYDSANREEYNCRELLDVMIALSGKSWKADTGLTLNNPGPKAFVERLTEHAANNGWLLAWVLYLDGEAVAMEYQLEYDGVVSGLRADYDQAFDDLSPGTLLNWRIIERLFGRGASYYSLGPGSNAYKKRWAEEEVELNSVLVYAKSWRGRTLRMVDTVLRPAARKMKHLFTAKKTNKH